MLSHMSMKRLRMHMRNLDTAGLLKLKKGGTLLTMSNPFTQEKCDKTTILDLCEKVYVLKTAKKKKSQTNRKNPQDPVLCLAEHESNTSIIDTLPDFSQAA